MEQHYLFVIKETNILVKMVTDIYFVKDVNLYTIKVLRLPNGYSKPSIYEVIMTF